MRTGLLAFLILCISLWGRAQVMEGNYALTLNFTRPATPNVTYDCQECSFIIQSGIPSVVLDYKITDPATASTNHAVLKAGGTGSFMGENFRIEGKAVFETFENGQSDMAAEAALVMDGQAVTGSDSYSYTGTFTVLKDGESIFEGTFEASMDKGGYTARLIRGTAEITRPGGGTAQALVEGQESALGLNEQLRTSENTLLELLLAGESILKVKSNTVLSLIKPGYSLQQGEAWFSLRSPAQLITPVASFRTGKSEFIIRVDKESSVVNLLEGQMTVSDKIGNTVNLEAGQAIKATNLGLGAVVGFDANQVRNDFDGKQNKLGNLDIQINTLLIVGVVLAVIVILLILRIMGKKRKKSKGAPLPPSPPVPEFRNTIRTTPAPPPVIPQPKPGSAAVFCENCGTKLVEGAKFCTVCGTRVL